VALASSISTVDFQIIHGLRTKEEEAQYVACGKSETMDSRHITGDAIDFAVLVNGEIDWKDVSLYNIVAEAFKQASEQLRTPIIWGGDWITLKDFGHVELNRKFYP